MHTRDYVLEASFKVSSCFKLLKFFKKLSKFQPLLVDTLTLTDILQETQDKDYKPNLGFILSAATVIWYAGSNSGIAMAEKGEITMKTEGIPAEVSMRSPMATH